MITADTSVVVPSPLGWHEHPTARPATEDVDRLPAHVLAESYSVLTRLRGLAAAGVRGGAVQHAVVAATVAGVDAELLTWTGARWRRTGPSASASEPRPEVSHGPNPAGV